MVSPEIDGRHECRPYPSVSLDDRRWPSANSYHTAHGVDQLRRIVSDAVLEHELDVFDVGDAHRRIAFDDDEIGVLARRDRTEVVGPSQELRTVQSRDADRL